ncbi:copper resistance CopC family protein [Glycomyces niveus]|uniref:Copper resistance protein CopC n=1 Tax=Glycomyces niveus TaxID=2820287 RepID=A0ABS3U9X1_9ACTN|nr:copper resistance CopC family protein [Glycomyces sp. NEAU-S30]MBO3735580.1 copper resistance protein CopC [Glycomyces sp. NEAU-S30]
MSLRASQRQPLRRAAALALAAAAGGVLTLGPAAPASAHAALTGTDPEDGATVAEAPAEVTATFSELLDGPSTEIAVTDPTGAVVDVADPTFDGDTFTQPMLYTTPGEYTVAFRVISEDGHRVDDAITFTVESIPEGLYAPGAEPTVAATTDGAATEPATQEETSRATGGLSSEDEEDSNTGAALAAILLGLLVVVVGGVVLVKTLGRKEKTEDGEGSA